METNYSGKGASKSGTKSTPPLVYPCAWLWVCMWNKCKHKNYYYRHRAHRKRPNCRIKSSNRRPLTAKPCSLHLRFVLGLAYNKNLGTGRCLKGEILRVKRWFWTPRLSNLRLRATEGEGKSAACRVKLKTSRLVKSLLAQSYDLISPNEEYLQQDTKKSNFTI